MTTNALAPAETLLGTTFNSRRLTSNSDPVKYNNFVDTTDQYANYGRTIDFLYVPTGFSVSVKAFITAFNETYSSDWATETVFGRVDPIAMFKQTTRSVTIGFRLVASTRSEAYENLYKLDVLRSYLYPTYTGTGGDGAPNALTLAQSPLVRVKVMNILTDGKQAATYDNLFGLNSAAAAAEGALVTIKNMSVSHNIENPSMGVFEGPRNFDGDNAVILPRAIDVSLDLMVVHEIFPRAEGVYGTDMLHSLHPEAATAQAGDGSVAEGAPESIEPDETAELEPDADPDGQAETDAAALQASLDSGYGILANVLVRPFRRRAARQYLEDNPITTQHEMDMARVQMAGINTAWTSEMYSTDTGFSDWHGTPSSNASLPNLFGGLTLEQSMGAMDTSTGLEGTSLNPAGGAADNPYNAGLTGYWP